MPIPEHYQRFYRFFLRFALIMLVFGGVAGLIFQEQTGKLSFEELSPGVRFEGIYRLAILHGHSFLIGSVMPICWIAALQISLMMGCRPVGPKALKLIVWTYIPGAISVIGLICYKGLHYVSRIKAGDRDFDAIHAGLFGGNRLARGLVYGTSHTIATVGLVVFAVVAWRSLNEQKKAPSDGE